VKVDVLQADLTRPADIARVEARLRDDASISTLINNAGRAQTGGLVAQTADAIDRLITLNTSTPTRLAAAFMERDCRCCPIVRLPRIWRRAA
jgi:short-subunit dehydrogenase